MLTLTYHERGRPGGAQTVITAAGPIEQDARRRFPDLFAEFDRQRTEGKVSTDLENTIVEAVREAAAGIVEAAE